MHIIYKVIFIAAAIALPLLLLLVVGTVIIKAKARRFFEALAAAIQNTDMVEADIAKKLLDKASSKLGVIGGVIGRFVTSRILLKSDATNARLDKATVIFLLDKLNNKVQSQGNVLIALCSICAVFCLIALWFARP